MLPNTLTLSAADVNTATDLVLTKRSEQNGVSIYTGVYTGGSPVADRRVTVEVKHTRPSNPQSKMSSLVKSSIDIYDANGTFLRTIRTWTVLEGIALTEDWGTFALNLVRQISGHTDFESEFVNGSY